MNKMLLLSLTCPFFAAAMNNESLSLGVQRGDLNSVRSALAYGADVNTQILDRTTPLNIAAWYKNTAMVKLLLAHGADVHMKNKDGNTPLSSTVLSSFFADHVDTMKLLIAQGAVINTQNKDGNSPLHEAAIHGLGTMAEFLIENDADINMQNYAGDTPLHLAAMFPRNLRAAAVLLNHGADINLKNRKGQTAYTIAICNGNEEMRDLFMQKLASLAKQESWLSRITQIVISEPSASESIQSAAQNS